LTSGGLLGKEEVVPDANPSAMQRDLFRLSARHTQLQGLTRYITMVLLA
jgi:hypothetical protein